MIQIRKINKILLIISLVLIILFYTLMITSYIFSNEKDTTNNEYLYYPNHLRASIDNNHHSNEIKINYESILSRNKSIKKFTKKIFFLKTHKTGSSTIHNILARMTFKYNLNTLLLNGNGYGYVSLWPTRFHSHHFYIPPKYDNPSLIFDIFMEHVRFNKEECEKLFPRNNTFYFTIMRDPIKYWRSAFEYFRIDQIFRLSNKSNPIKKFFKKKLQYHIPKWKEKNMMVHLIQNSYLFDLGYNDDTITASNLDNIIKEIEENFDLVIITEYFDEGLIVFKNQLNLDFNDVVAFIVNEGLNTRREQLDEITEEEIDKLNYADRYVYNYFKKKFEDTYLISDEIKKSAKYLKTYRQQLYSLCINGRKPKIAYTNVYYLGYELKPNLNVTDLAFCEKLVYSELEIKDLMVKHMKEIFAL